MPTVPRWGVATAVAAPALLAIGWTVGALLQPGSFDQVSRTFSELAAQDAAHRWVMSAALVGTGACLLATALALRPAAITGRIVLGCAGLSTMLIAAFPLPAAGVGSTSHAVVAVAAFSSLAVWPFFSTRHGAIAPWALRRGTATSAGIVLVVATALFFHGVVTEASAVGLVERVAAILLNLWPLAVAVSARRFASVTRTDDNAA